MISTEEDLQAAMFNDNHALDDTLLNHATHSFIKVLNSLVEKERFPKEVLLVQDKHNGATHALVGNLYRQDGLWVLFSYDSRLPLVPLNIIGVKGPQKGIPPSFIAGRKINKHKDPPSLKFKNY